MPLATDTRSLVQRLARLDARTDASLRSEYGFLLGRFIDSATLARATAIAGRWSAHPHHVLIATGWIDADDYYRALAEACGATFRAELPVSDVTPASANPRQCLATGLLKERWRARHLILAPDRLAPNALRHVLAQLYPHNVALASPHAVREAIRRHFAASFSHGAIEALASRFPERSARTKPALWQRLSLVFTALTILGAFSLAPIATLWVLTLLLALLFVPVIALRIAALCHLMRGEAGGGNASRVADDALPVYTILLPAYHEAHMLPGLIQAMTQLDWPAAKLDIKLILEATDRETIAAAAALTMPGNVETVIVPDLHPRTKPKALNYALPLARGKYLAIYDAEDRPDRGQLRSAFEAFRTGPPNLATVQARLNLYNPRDNWLTQQFTIEYSALFDGLLPTLDRLDLPIPLGGSSNHFRVSALTWLMAWDPFNVTEDADLGMRLSRNGYRCKVLRSTTYEEAPRRFRPWLGQRTRWLKGFMQTWLVHMRSPLGLWRELGSRGFLAFQTMVGGTVLSALVHPWFYALAAFELFTGGMLVRPESLLGWPFWLIAWFALVSGYLASMALGLVSVRGRGYGFLCKQTLLMPLYWLLISFAAYRALWQFMTARFTWEKTEHGLARNVVLPPLPR